jgi:hypothetical protein
MPKNEESVEAAVLVEVPGKEVVVETGTPANVEEVVAETVPITPSPVKALVNGTFAVTTPHGKLDLPLVGRGVVAESDSLAMLLPPDAKITERKTDAGIEVDSGIWPVPVLHVNKEGVKFYAILPAFSALGWEVAIDGEEMTITASERN